MAFINKTKMGQAMLAVSEDRGAATLMGINVNRTISVTFAIGSALAAVAGVLLCSAYPSLSPYTGSMPGIKAFVAAVFGGIGSIPGAFIGGILLGIIENLAKAYISSQLSDAIVFSVLIIVLLVRPDRYSRQEDDGESIIEKIIRWFMPGDFLKTGKCRVKTRWCMNCNKQEKVQVFKMNAYKINSDSECDHICDCNRLLHSDSDYDGRRPCKQSFKGYSGSTLYLYDFGGFLKPHGWYPR